MHEARGFCQIDDISTRLSLAIVSACRSRLQYLERRYPLVITERDAAQAEVKTLKTSNAELEVALREKAEELEEKERQRRSLAAEICGGLGCQDSN